MDQKGPKMMRYLNTRRFQLVGEQGKDWLHIYEGEKEGQKKKMKIYTALQDLILSML